MVGGSGKLYQVMSLQDAAERNRVVRVPRIKRYWSDPRKLDWTSAICPGDAASKWLALRLET